MLKTFVGPEEVEAVERKVQIVQRAAFTLIHETEIGMAIVKMDLQRYCNPKPPSTRSNLLFVFTLLLPLLFFFNIMFSVVLFLLLVVVCFIVNCRFC
jgi:hypothetical protein